ncbi:MAG: carboxypeptidase-like regulatory domain-containing protein [Gemmatimonadaceae bacterium]|nr:carboxypeptidase-like regulatory domain-containing protein [Gemmatimonadaceae bacterium]
MRRRGSCAWLGLASVIPALLSAQTSVLRGRVIDARSKRAVPATVEFRAADTTIVREGASTYAIPALPAGRFELIVRAIGYQSVTMRVELAANDTVDADVELERIATKLAKVRTDSVALPAVYAGRLAEFEERRAFGIGRFLDWTFFAQNQNRALSSLLDGRFASLRVNRKGTAKHQFTTSRSGRACPPQVLINGVIDDEYDLSLLDTREVIGFEYYTPTNTPLKFNRTTIGRDRPGSACGTVLLWLR